MSTTIDVAHSDKDKPFREFGQVLQEIRKNLGLSQKKMADELEVAQGYYGHWEQGRARPSAKVLTRIANQYRIHLAEQDLDLSQFMRIAGYSEDEINKAVEENRRRGRDTVEVEGIEEIRNAQQLQLMEVKPDDKNASSDPSLAVLRRRLDWAFHCISQDPTYVLPQNALGTNLPDGYKVFIVQIYQTQTHRNLLTPEENEELNRIGPV